MPSPVYLEHCTDEIVELANAFNETVIADIARKLVKTGTITDSALHQIQIELESGYLMDEIIQKVSQVSGMSKELVTEAVKDAGMVTVAENSELSQQAGYQEIKMNTGMLRAISAATIISNKEINNLTATTAISSQQSYMQAATTAFMQVTSGFMAYEQAIADAIRDVASKGTYVYYPSGHRDTVDVALRRSVLSAVNSSGGAITLLSCKESGCDYVETTAHSGARQSHELWQGKICCISGKDKSYPDFYQFTGYGTGAGLCGWNCRHSFHMFFPGFSTPAYTDEMLKDFTSKKYQWKGKAYTDYECSQIQRGYERKIRESKRILAGYDAAAKSTDDIIVKRTLGERFANESVKLKKKETELKQFCNSTDRYVVSSRTQVRAIRDDKGNTYGFTKSVSQKAVHAAKSVKANQSRFIDNLSNYVNVKTGKNQDVITHQNIYRNLYKTDIGKEIIKYVEKHPELSISLLYNVDCSPYELGRQYKDNIYVYVSNTKTIQRTVETIIHEVTHHRYDIGSSLWAECVCRAQEMKHRNDRERLTGAELRNIIKYIKRAYPDIKNWR